MGVPNPYGDNSAFRLQAPPPFRVRFDAIGDAWRLVVADMMRWAATYFLVTIVELALSFGVGYFLGTWPGSRGYSIHANYGKLMLQSAILLPLSIVMQVCVAGMQHSGVRQARGYTQSFGDSFRFNGMLGQVLIVSVVWSLIEFGHQALVIAGLSSGHSWVTDPSAFAAMWLINLGVGALYWIVALTSLVIIDQQQPAISALRISLKTFGPKVFMLWLVLLCAGVFAALGILACCVGFVFTGPLGVVIYSVIYNDFFRPIPSQASAQSSEGYLPPWQG